MRELARWAAIAVVFTACTGDPDDLDPEVVRDLSVTSGNAIGLQRSGEYVAELEVLECSGCAAILELAGQGTCALASGDSITEPISLVQSDGVLLMNHRDVAAVGPLDADGQFALGSLADLSSALAELRVVARVDGAFEDDTSSSFTGVIRQRTHGGTSAGDLLDCYETFGISAVRISPP
jgi:hypothetical protein